MRRKDVLIIAATLIIISFISVFAIYCIVNEDNVFSTVTNKLSEVIESEKEYHANGWETSVVDKIKYDVPIPVGFTYIEGNPNKGMMIENNETKEKYMWIPLGVNTNVELDTNLELGTQESMENIQKYGGFYVAIDERSEEERFEDYLKENAKSYEVYYQTKELGYEGYKKLYKETTGEEFDLNNIVIDEKTKLDNYKKTSILETHTLTIEELASINTYEEQIGQDIVLKNCKTLTLSKRYVNTENKLTEEKIEEAIEYVSEVTGKTEKKIKEEIGYSTNDYAQMKKLLIEQVNNKETTYNKIISILNGAESNDTTSSDTQKENKGEAIYVETEEAEDIRSGWSKEIIAKETEEGVPIPKGFEQVEGTKVETGLKITNRSNLTFIWIPVKEVDERSIEEIINGTYEKNLEELGEKESVIRDYTKEASLTKEEKAEYENLIKSIKKYGGFYISEAELGYDENGVTINNYRNMVEKWGEEWGYNYVSNGDYYRNVDEDNYYEEGTRAGESQREFNNDERSLYEKAIEKCEDLYEDSMAVVSHLTYGIEYKAVINYLIETGSVTTKEAFEDSTKIGKYKDTIEKHGVYAEENFLNGIYGIAGNLAEITRGKDEDGNVAIRGGSWNDLGTDRSLGSVIWKDTEKIDDEKLGSVGFRACLYIKPEYNKEENEKISKKLEDEIDNKIGEIKKYINETSIKIGEEEHNYFNNIYKEGTEEYENEALNDMIKWAEGQMKKETSTAMFNKFVEYVKDEVDRIVDNIEVIIGYTGGYTYEINEETKELNEKCWQEKANAMGKMQNLRWAEGILIDSEGKQVSYAEIRKEAENKINEIMAKAEKKEEQPKEPVTNETIEEVAKKFLETGPKTWGYYESWKTEYEKLKDEYYNKINNATSKEEAEKLSTEGIDKINEMVDKVIAEKEKEINKDNNKKEKTQYQKDIEAGYKVYKSTDVKIDETLDENKLGIGKKLEDKEKFTYIGQSIEVVSNEEYCNFAIVVLNEYTDVHISSVVDGGYSVVYFDSAGEVKFRIYFEDGDYQTYKVTVKEEEIKFEKGTIFYTLEKMYEQGSITSFGWVDLNGNWSEKNTKGNLKSLDIASNRIAFNATVNGSSWMFINLKGTNRFITRKPFAKADYDVAIKTKDQLWNTLNNGRKTNYTNYINLPTKTDYKNLFKERNTNDMNNYKFWYGITMSDADEFYVVKDGDGYGSGIFEIEKEVTDSNIDDPTKQGKAAWSKYFDRDDNLHINQKYRLVVELNLNK